MFGTLISEYRACIDDSETDYQISMAENSGLHISLKRQSTFGTTPHKFFKLYYRAVKQLPKPRTSRQNPLLARLKRGSILRT